MGRVQYGSIITGIKGSVGGQVFQGGNTTPVLRNKGYRKGTSSNLRSKQTRLLSSVAGAWRLVADSNRVMWEGIRQQWPFKDKFGNTYYGSAFQVFCAYNALLIQLGEPITLVPGSPITSDDPGPLYFTEFNTGQLVVQWDNTISQAQSLKIFASYPQSPGRTNASVQKKLIAVVDMTGGSSYDMTIDYATAWNALPAGARIFFDFYVATQGWPINQYPQSFNGLLT